MSSLQEEHGISQSLTCWGME